MNNDIFDDLAIEGLAKREFGVTLDIEKVYVRSIPAGRSVNATLILTNKNKLYAVIMGAAPLTLGDVRKIALRMGLKVEAYCAPKGKPNYFSEVAEEKFKSVYPGRHDITENDLRFYRLMAPYNPALISIEEIKNGMINQYDPNAASGWRPAVKASYKLIKTK